MDITKIKIGRESYNIKDATVRSWIDGTGDNSF